MKVLILMGGIRNVGGVEEVFRFMLLFQVLENVFNV